MSAAKTFVLHQVVSVRVGAEVEITTFHQPKTSLWDGSISGHEEAVIRNEAVVRDLESGVVYGTPGHFRAGELNPLLVAAENLRGRIVACQVRSGHQADNRFLVETWLAVEPATGAAYR